MRKTFVGIAGALVLLLTSACGTHSDGPGDGDYRPPSQWQQVGGNSYVFTTCDHGNRVYWVTTNQTDSIAVVDKGCVKVANVPSLP